MLPIESEAPRYQHGSDVNKKMKKKRMIRVIKMMMNSSPVEY